MTSTRDEAYSERLVDLQTVWWKRLLPVQAPYAWNLRRLCTGATLDIGCGIGRNLANLRGAGVGIDHNSAAVAVARDRGFDAYTTDEFPESEHARPGVFDSMLLAHVLEHMERDAAAELVRTYLPYLRSGARVVLVTPQERGFRSDASHVTWLDFEGLRAITRECGLRDVRERSFPFPRALGKVFVYNEFVIVAERGV